MFYFTAQDNPTGQESYGRAYDVYQYDSASGTSSKVASGTVEHARAIVSGAVNPLDNSYYFGYYNTPANSASTFVHLYRYTNGTASEVTVIETDNPNRRTFTNGDFAFDAGGNLLMVISSAGGSQGGAGWVFTASLDADSLANAIQTGTPVRRTSQTAQKQNADAGAAYNGVIFTDDGQLIVQQGSTQTITNPSTFARVPGTTSRVIRLFGVSCGERG